MSEVGWKSHSCMTEQYGCVGAHTFKLYIFITIYTKYK